VDFYFPDSQDQIDPAFDFKTEERLPHRVRQRDDLYAHEVHDQPPYTGMLVSKGIVDGLRGVGAGRYTAAQRHRLYRLGVRDFFRLPPHLRTLGDCGAFSYVSHERPPYTVDEVINFYEHCGFDLGISVDHVILGYAPQADEQGGADPDWVERQGLTLQLAQEFLDRREQRRCNFTPMGVAQGWSPASYAYAVQRLQEMGYERIALGGMVPLKTDQIIACLKAISEHRNADTQLHLLGVTRTDSVEAFQGYGVTSFDSTSPFRQAFKDDRDNYYAPSGPHYTALRIPQVDANTKLQRRIQAGDVDQDHARRLERACRTAIRDYDSGQGTVSATLAALVEYEEMYGEVKEARVERYRRTLDNAPWQSCPCAVCRDAGAEVIVFRGTERNKRRGFHNLFVFFQKLRNNLDAVRPAESEGVQ